MNEYDATELAFKNGYEKGVRDTKAEVAREIFEEIDILVETHKISQFENSFDDIFTELIAELKKKYTEEPKQ